jgi:DNA-directed RNA polymerase specialized sigma24 family protein
VSLSQAATTRSRDEVAAAIRAFTPADWARLKRVAAKYAFARPISPEDLIQEAFLRALDTRVCPADVDVVKFLAEIIRSVADGEAQKVEHKSVLVPIANTGGPDDRSFDVADEAGDAETQKLNAEHAETCVVACAGLIALFDDDPAAQLILEGMMDDIAGEELRELTGLDKVAYDSKRRLIRRKIAKHYPNGWKP